MKKTLFLLLFIPSLAFAAHPGMMENDSNGRPMQGAAPNGLLSQTLTVNSTTIEMNLWWGMYTPVDCKVRIMPTTAKGSYPQFTALSGTFTSRLVNRLTPFINFSGCTGGELQRQ